MLGWTTVLGQRYVTRPEPFLFKTPMAFSAPVGRRPKAERNFPLRVADGAL